MVCIATYDDNGIVIGCIRDDGASGGLDFLNDCKALKLEIVYKTKAELDAELLLGIKAQKTQEINTAFNTETNENVDVDGVLYVGGYDSALKLDGAKRFSELASTSTVTFYDASDVGHDLAIADATVIILTIGAKYQADFAKHKSLKKQIADATSIDAVDAIVW